MEQQEPLIQLPLDQIQPLQQTISSPAQETESQNLNENTNNNDIKNRRPRSKWTAEETEDLIKGCANHGVGNWKKILEDPSLKFNNRTSVDLKDRFRTYFPEDYKRLYPNATSTRERATVQQLAPEAATFSKAKRKERTPFSKAEDENLLIGFGKYGGKWSLIQKDETLGLQHRRSTDLRDRFRNAYPDKYIGAGFKPPPAKRRRRNDPEDASSVNDNQTIQTDPLQPVFQFHHDLPSHTPLSTASLQTQDATIPTPVRRELAAAIASAQPMNDTFSLTRLSWTNPHNVTAQREREMALKIRRAMDMSNPAEMLTDRDIPLDPGLSDVAYQPDEQTNNAETLTGLLDAASQHRSWKRE